MNRGLLVVSLLCAGVLLILQAETWPYEWWVRRGAWLLIWGGATTALIPVLTRRRGGDERIGWCDLDTQTVRLGKGSDWEEPEAQAFLDEGALCPGGDLLTLPVATLDQHMLILGTTGSGKTRMLEILIAQAILRGEAVLVIDPKGDARLLRCVEAACRRAGRWNDLRLLSLPHPEKSIRYNPIGMFQDVREVADRLAALLPSTGESRVFRSYAWEVVHVISAALVAAGESVTLSALRQATAEPPWELAARLIHQASGGSISGTDGQKLSRIYRKRVRGGSFPGLSELDALIALASRPRDHYAKMIASFIPVLNRLAAFPILNGNELGWDDASNGRVVVFHLGSLIGADSASAVARMALLDLQSFIGRRYADGGELKPFSVFVDEAADVVTPAFVHLLNKGRGAGLRMTAALQTLSDLEVALESRAAAVQVEGNASTVVQFRAQNSDDAEVFSRLGGERMLRMRSEAERYEPALFSSGFRNVDDFRASFGVQVSRKPMPLVPPWAVTGLPRFSFFVSTPDGVRLGRAPLLEIDDADHGDTGASGVSDRRGGLVVSSG